MKPSTEEIQKVESQIFDQKQKWQVVLLELGKKLHGLQKVSSSEPEKGPSDVALNQESPVK